MNEEWKKGFHNKLNDYETTPPQGLFDEILKHIPPVEEGEKTPNKPTEVPIAAANTNKKQQVKAAIWLTAILSAAAIVTILLVNNSVVDVANHTNTIGNLADNNKNVIESRSGETATSSPDNAYTNSNGNESTPTVNAKSRIFASIKTVFKAVASTVLPQNTADKTTLAMVEQPTTTTEPTDKADNIQETTVSEVPKPSEKVECSEPTTHQRPTTPTTNSRPRRNKNSVQLGMLLAGMPTVNSSDDLYSVAPTAMKENNGMIVTGQNKMVKKANHRQPITLGVSVALPLSSKISVETGLIYSHHYSELAYEVGNISHDIKQHLNFVGIPLNLNYRLWQRHNTSVYVSGGGSVEKMVYGKQKERYDGTETTIANKVEMKELQWALSARFGAAYKLTKGVSFYLEPGVSYHFNNKSDLQTIYSDRPVSFQLKAGLRFNLR
ncbi:outer membrane beta-barrel protein [Prevotella intermedia]|uniref:PorT family protein n=1 Tax=Prevotella intermedia TaxID=28131 RepID=A0A2D3NBY9_PREIN|nr:outer membrane beta-barrel protein [Prevotella intermedia]ATV52895.1 PorT family protein [Prevotella intermedia]